MAPTISVTTAVFNRLQERAVPLKDTPNSVIEKLLNEVERLREEFSQKHNPPSDRKEEEITQQEIDIDIDETTGSILGILEEQPTRSSKQSTRHNSDFGNITEELLMETLGQSFRKYSNQRELMRTLFEKFNQNREESIKAYAWMEANEYIIRARNSHLLSPEDYAQRLFNDGIKKGWLG